MIHKVYHYLGNIRKQVYLATWDCTINPNTLQLKNNFSFHNVFTVTELLILSAFREKKSVFLLWDMLTLKCLLKCLLIVINFRFLQMKCHKWKEHIGILGEEEPLTFLIEYLKHIRKNIYLERTYT